jgi:hypothetical protein
MQIRLDNRPGADTALPIIHHFCPNEDVFGDAGKNLVDLLGLRAGVGGDNSLLQVLTLPLFEQFGRAGV